METEVLSKSIFTLEDEILIDKCYEFSLSLVAEALKILQKNVGNEHKFISKDVMTDLVTETDKEIEIFIFNEIKKNFPSHKCIGEETSHDDCKLTDTFTWILDPIDGTTNFIHNFPYYAISLAGVYKQQIVIGIVQRGSNGDVYSAKINGGAFLNGKTNLRVSNVTDKNFACLVTEWGCFREYEDSKSKCDSMFSLFTKDNSLHGIRSLGCASLNLCYVAAGCFDAYYEWGLHCWDMAAGVLIVLESGGHVSGECFDLMSRNILATSTSNLSRELVSYLPKLSIGRDDNC